jgi:hypothetical protein
MAHYPVIECACHFAMHAGASLLAMVANDNAKNLKPCGGLGFFASKLAPTVTDKTAKIVQPRVVSRR